MTTQYAVLKGLPNGLVLDAGKLFTLAAPDTVVTGNTFSFSNRTNANTHYVVSIVRATALPAGDYTFIAYIGSSPKAEIALTFLGTDGETATETASLAVLDSASRATLVDEIWDEVLTGGTHNVQNSAGKRLRQVISSVIHAGTAQGPGTSSNQIVLDIGASSVNGAYDPAGIYISGGTGSGQSRLILDYVGSTKTATVDRSWKVNPDATSEFVVYGNPGREHVNEGLAVAGTSNSITLNSSASAYDNIYVGQSVFIRSGTGEDQIGVITTYNGTTKVATIVTGAVGGQWETIPDTTSAYVMLPSGPSLLSAASISAVQTGISTLTAAQVNAEVLDVLNTDTFGELAAPPAATSSLKDKLTWLFMWIRNKGTATATQRKLYADDGTTLVSTETITDDGTTFTKGEAS